MKRTRTQDFCFIQVWTHFAWSHHIYDVEHVQEIVRRFTFIVNLILPSYIVDNYFFASIVSKILICNVTANCCKLSPIHSVVFAWKIYAARRDCYLIHFNSFLSFNGCRWSSKMPCRRADPEVISWFALSHDKK